MTMYEDYREGKIHGNTEFPFDIYACSIPDIIPEVLPHWHDEMELIYVQKGCGCISVDGDTREVKGPCLVIVLPGHLHAIRRSGSGKLEYRNILFRPELMYSKAGQISDWEYLRPLFDGRFRIPAFLGPELPQFTSLIEPLEACGDRGDDLGGGYPLLVKSQLFLLFYRLLLLFPEKYSENGGANRQSRIKPVLTYLMENYSENISIADAAAVAGFSEAHFMRFFRENMGVSFVNYLKSYRLSRAEELIRTTENSILSVAQDTGYPNLSYFIRNFKQRYGMTPLQYRKARQSR